jgi:hypothetical protein
MALGLPTITITAATPLPANRLIADIELSVSATSRPSPSLGFLFNSARAPREQPAASKPFPTYLPAGTYLHALTRSKSVSPLCACRSLPIQPSKSITPQIHPRSPTAPVSNRLRLLVTLALEATKTAKRTITMADFDPSTLNDTLNYVPLKSEFDGSNSLTGGNSLTEDLNVWYQVCVCVRIRYSDCAVS